MVLVGQKTSLGMRLLATSMWCVEKCTHVSKTFEIDENNEQAEPLQHGHQYYKTHDTHTSNPDYLYKFEQDFDILYDS